MANPLETIKKIRQRSFKELRERGEQAVRARAEQIGLGGGLPTDAEFFNLIDRQAFGGKNFTAADLREKFYEDAAFNFFPAFRQKEIVGEIYRERFAAAGKIHVARAERIINGKFDLLGYENLDFGAPVDWRYEPLADKRIALKHWKQFDELSTGETGDRKIVWELNRHQHFFTLGVAFWLTGDERYAETCAAHLDAWMQQNPPGAGINWASSLEVAFRVTSWTWALNFFRDSAYFTPALFQKILKFVYQHGRHLSKYLSTYYSPNTHLTGEALGLFYLGTQFQFFKAAASWRETGARILFEELDRQILADGVYFEQSTWYQRYTTDFYTHFLILQTLSGAETEPNLQSKLGARLQSLADFLLAATRPDGTTPLIGDDDGGALLPRSSNRRPDDFRATLATNAVLFERGDYKTLAGELAEETVWLLGATGAHSFDSLRARLPVETSKAFPDGGYYAMRGGYTETDDFLLIDCGALGALSGGHGHADALSLDLSVGGRRTLVDSGTYTYHESEAARHYFRSSGAHNTLTIDGESQSEPGGKFSWLARANAEARRWIAQDRFDFFEGAHDGYERLRPAPATHARGVLFLKNDYWIVRDFVETAGKHDYRLNFHFDAECAPQIRTAARGVNCVTEKPEAGVGLRIFTFGDNGGWELKETSVSDCYGRKAPAPLVQFASSGTGAQEFFTFLLPVENGFNAPQVVETEVRGGRAFVIEFRDYQDVLVFADGAETVRTELFNTNFRFLWARLPAGEAAPEEYVLVGGTHFSIGSRDVINYPRPLEYATARRFGNKLNVQTPDGVFKVSLP